MSVHRLCLFSLDIFSLVIVIVLCSTPFFEGGCSSKVINNQLIFEMDLSLQHFKFPVIIEIHFCYKCINNRYVKIT